jgi:type VI protein secretion system component VasK
MIADRIADLVAAYRALGIGPAQLAQRPWFAVLGPTGVGKTTLLRACGLDFAAPVNDDPALRGLEGTHDVDFWLHERALYIDLAGRYCRRDQREEYRALLTNLGGIAPKKRPGVDGALAVLPAEALLANDPAELQQFIAPIIEQYRLISEVSRRVFPLWFLISKLDRLAGFQAFISGFSEEARQRALGYVLPYRPMAGAEMAAAMSDGWQPILHGIQQAQRKCCLLGPMTARGLAFPDQIARLHQRFATVLPQALAQVGADTNHAYVRGVFLTSSRRDAETASLLSEYDLPPARVAKLTPSGRLPTGVNKSCFAPRLLADLILADADLAQPLGTVIEHAVRRHRWALVVTVLAVLALTSWWARATYDEWQAMQQARNLVASLQAEHADPAQALTEYAERKDAFAARSQQVVPSEGTWDAAGVLRMRGELLPALQLVYLQAVREQILAPLVSERQDFLRGWIARTGRQAAWAQDQDAVWSYRALLALQSLIDQGPSSAEAQALMSREDWQRQLDRWYPQQALWPHVWRSLAVQLPRLQVVPDDVAIVPRLRGWPWAQAVVRSLPALPAAPVPDLPALPGFDGAAAQVPGHMLPAHRQAWLATGQKLAQEVTAALAPLEIAVDVVPLVGQEQQRAVAAHWLAVVQDVQPTAQAQAQGLATPGSALSRWWNALMGAANGLAGPRASLELRSLLAVQERLLQTTAPPWPVGLQQIPAATAAEWAVVEDFSQRTQAAVATMAPYWRQEIERMVQPYEHGLRRVVEQRTLAAARRWWNDVVAPLLSRANQEDPRLVERVRNVLKALAQVMEVPAEVLSWLDVQQQSWAYRSSGRSSGRQGDRATGGSSAVSAGADIRREDAEAVELRLVRRPGLRDVTWWWGDQLCGWFDQAIPAVSGQLSSPFVGFAIAPESGGTIRVEWSGAGAGVALLRAATWETTSKGTYLSWTVQMNDDRLRLSGAYHVDVVLDAQGGGEVRRDGLQVSVEKLLPDENGALPGLNGIVQARLDPAAAAALEPWLRSGRAPVWEE